MKLYEFEGKQLFRSSGIIVPNSSLVDSNIDINLKPPLVVKAQVLSGKRGKSGMIRFCKTKEEAQDEIKKLIGQQINRENVNKLLIEEQLDIKNEYYAGITYDTRTRSPVIVLCKDGGIDIEKYKEKFPERLIIEPIDLNIGLTEEKINYLLKKAGFKKNNLSHTLTKLFECFTAFDCTLAEINPLVETKDNKIMAADAKVVLDDDALFRHKDLNLQERHLAGREPTKREIEARNIDKDDHRGTAGSTFIELGGDIAVLASGGGASLTCMDALIEFGGRPANYTEYSGNPPDYKVKKLTKVTLSIPGLNGLWVCGGTANFTDIYETLKGFLKGLREIKPKPDYPIVIRRAGPRDKEAFKMLKQASKDEGWDFHLYGDETPMTKTAEIIVDLVNKYKLKKYVLSS